MSKGKIRSILLYNRSVPYQIRFSKRAKHIRLNISRRDGLVVVIPTGKEHIDVEPLLQKKSNWILDKIDHYSSAISKSGSRTLKENSELQYLGKKYLLKNNSLLKENKVILNQNGIHINLNILNQYYDAQLKIHNTLEKWYRKEARLIFEDKVTYYSSKLNVKVNRIAIKDQKTRWGSCSSLKNLNFNWRLVMAPIEVIDYMVIHEISHLIEPNHSSRFWSIVEQFCPKFREYDHWLKQHGNELYF